MKIDTVKFNNIENAYLTKKSEPKSVKNKESDTVQISQLGKYLNKVSENKEEINIEKIDDIKKRIESGTYKVDSKDLARKIIEKTKGDLK